MANLNFEARIHASRQWIWEMLIDVPQWGKWDLEVKESQLDGAFGVGVKGYLLDANSKRSTFEIIDIQRNQEYSNKYFFPFGTRLYFTHQIIGDAAPYQVRFKADFRGPLALYYRWKLSGDIQSTMKNALGNLSALASKSAA